MSSSLTLDERGPGGPGPDPIGASVRRASWWSQLLVIGWLYWLYDAVNNLSAVRERSALSHASSIWRLEGSLRINVEHALNRWTDANHLIGLLLADFYDIAHLFVTLALILVLWWRFPAAYRPLRTALVTVNLIGFAVFWCYPVAPPRMLSGFIDVVSATHAIGSWHSGTLGSAANEFAAMPSLHVAWALWCTVAVWRVTKRAPWRIVAVAHTVLTVVAVLATANHFTLDVVAGFATGLLSLAIAAAWERRPRRLAFRA